MNEEEKQYWIRNVGFVPPVILLRLRNGEFQHSAWHLNEYGETAYENMIMGHILKCNENGLYPDSDIDGFEERDTFYSIANAFSTVIYRIFHIKRNGERVNLLSEVSKEEAKLMTDNYIDCMQGMILPWFLCWNEVLIREENGVPFYKRIKEYLVRSIFSGLYFVYYKIITEIKDFGVQLFFKDEGNFFEREDQEKKILNGYESNKMAIKELQWNNKTVDEVFGSFQTLIHVLINLGEPYGTMKMDTSETSQACMRCGVYI